MRSRSRLWWKLRLCGHHLSEDSSAEGNPLDEVGLHICSSSFPAHTHLAA